MPADPVSIEPYRSAREERDKALADRLTLESSGGGGDSGGMDGIDKRLGLVETDLRSVRNDLAIIGNRLAAVEGKLDVLTSQVVAKIPTGWTMFGIIMSTMVGAVAVVGGAITIARYLRVLGP